MRATLIVPTYNRAPLVHHLLQRLCGMDLRDVAQVIICDDGSSDETARLCATFRRSLPLEYCYQADRGFRAGAARNLGIQRAVGDVLIFIDDDCLPLDGFVAAHCSAHAGPGQVVALGLRARIAAPVQNGVLRQWPELSAQDERLAALENGLQHHSAPWKLLFSCNFSLRRDNPEAYFDETFVGWGMEDTELGYRLWLARSEFRLLERATVLHVDSVLPRDPFQVEHANGQPDYQSYLLNCVRLLMKFPNQTPLWDSLLPDLCWYVRDSERGWRKDGHQHDPFELIGAIKDELCSTAGRPAGAMVMS